ncbi:MAG TPA: helix-turn-helix transcriptional regulator [Candidatus Fimimorpha faecalis]|uniref:Helix-turn-helix transcriptional regulator n=1 Tax=Candidatus Fimimorpha faecalis TaxID=2840824 RepID=A0A9D1EG57_9FIRM|nr:HTH-type transcriptional regulator ImmR [Clostridiales bacterium CHKCI001]HIR89796.1 helix-turn-helix transcriptional regulator [Candidatus Fimimorpha faecalis]
MKTIGERIIFLREKQRMSQKELATRLQITAASLSRYENNIHEPKSDILIRLAQILDTNTDFILGLDPNYNTKSQQQSFNILTPEEEQMLKHYRQLNFIDQIKVQERIATLLDQETS